MNNYKDLKRENQFKKKERESNKDLERERERERKREREFHFRLSVTQFKSIKSSLSQTTVHTPQQNPKIKREKEREAKCKIP